MREREVAYAEDRCFGSFEERETHIHLTLRDEHLKIEHQVQKKHMRVPLL